MQAIFNFCEQELEFLTSSVYGSGILTSIMRYYLYGFRVVRLKIYTTTQFPRYFAQSRKRGQVLLRVGYYCACVCVSVRKRRDIIASFWQFSQAKGAKTPTVFLSTLALRDFAAISHDPHRTVSTIKAGLSILHHASFSVTPRESTSLLGFVTKWECVKNIHRVTFISCRRDKT